MNGPGSLNPDYFINISFKIQSDSTGLKNEYFLEKSHKILKISQKSHKNSILSKTF